MQGKTTDKGRNSGRRLFCEINETCYQLSVMRLRLKRYARWLLRAGRFASAFETEPLAYRVYEHCSLIRRRLNGVDIRLQENKAVNLTLTVPKLNGILIKPGQTFSFWRLAGKCTRAKGYREGLTVTSKGPGQGVGGGMCQFANLIHWLVLHSDLTVTERHHHALDLFPDASRKVPFGTGTSIFYNYLDYQFENNTQNVYQFLFRVEGEYLIGELRCARPPLLSYHIREAEHHFLRKDGKIYRHNSLFREIFDKRTGNRTAVEPAGENLAEVCYGEEFIPGGQIREDLPSGVGIGS